MVLATLRVLRGSSIVKQWESLVSFCVVLWIVVGEVVHQLAGLRLAAREREETWLYVLS